jgi:hypothetical protein
VCRAEWGSDTRGDVDEEDASDLEDVSESEFDDDVIIGATDGELKELNMFVCLLEL